MNWKNVEGRDRNRRIMCTVLEFSWRVRGILRENSFRAVRVPSKIRTDDLTNLINQTCYLVSQFTLSRCFESYLMTSCSWAQTEATRHRFCCNTVVKQNTNACWRMWVFYAVLDRVRLFNAPLFSLIRMKELTISPRTSLSTLKYVLN
jgi:hypothetical protein